MTDVFPTLFERIFGKILALWRTDESRSGWLTLCFFIALVSICASIALIGAVPTFIAGHDNFFLLENGWRALQGLRPHLDFWSPWGPLTFLLVALGLKLSHSSPNGLAYGSAIFSLVVGLWTYLLGRFRLAPVPRALLSLYAVVLACSPHAIGSSPTSLSPAMIYNRYGYALLLPLLVESFQRREPVVRSAELSGGFSTGIALALTLFLKASYFLVGLGLLVTSFIFWYPSIRRFLGASAGFATITLLGLGYLRFDPAAMLHGLRLGAAARAQSLSLLTPMHSIASELVPLLCALALAVSASFLKPRFPELLGELHLPLTAVIISIADVALLSTNQQSSGLPLLGALAILIANRLTHPQNASSNKHDFALPYSTTVLMLAGLLFCPEFSLDALALPIAALYKIRPPAACDARFAESRVSDLILCNLSGLNPLQRGSNGSAYTAYVNDGVALLRRHC